MIENTIIIMRGWPGSGKTTLANKILDKLLNGVVGEDAHDIYRVLIVSADHYFIDFDGVYRFRKAAIGEAHRSCKAKFIEGLMGRSLIIVDNTNIKQVEYNEYIERGQKLGFKVFQAIPETNWMDDLEECYKRNLHGVPKETIARMMKDFEQDDRLPVFKLA